MQNFNPLLQNNNDGNRFITIGEIMLRLTPPNYEKIRSASTFEASYGGSEANIALALANLGVDSTFFSVVPNNSLGKSAIRMLRSNDVHCTPVILSTPEQTPTHRLGTYYIETGYGIRASKVIYDRKHSAIAEFDFSTVDLDSLLDGFTWLHLSGITPALSENCHKLITNCLKTASPSASTAISAANSGPGKKPGTTAPNTFLMWTSSSVSNPTISGRMKRTTAGAMSRTACRCSRAMNSRTRSFRHLWQDIRISSVSPAMYATPTAAAKTA